MQKGLKYGDLNGIQIQNLKLKSSGNAPAAPAPKKAAPKKKYGFIAVSVGEGINEIFTSLGVDYIISGGQTMNPSTEDMLNAIENVNAEIIFILPNNKNIIMAANQARDLTNDKQIIVIPTKTVPQGISALVGYVPEHSVDQNDRFVFLIPVCVKYHCFLLPLRLSAHHEDHRFCKVPEHVFRLVLAFDVRDLKTF